MRQRVFRDWFEPRYLLKVREKETLSEKDEREREREKTVGNNETAWKVFATT